MNDGANLVDPRNYLDAQISYFFSVRSPHPKKAPLSLRLFLDFIQMGRWAKMVSLVREANKDSKADADRAKKQLPLVKPSGLFSGSAEKNLIKLSGLLCLDYDDVGEEFPNLREMLSNDLYVLAHFLSPSGTGVKVFVPVAAATPYEHKQCWHAAFRHFSKKPGGELIDKAPKNVSANCFVSYDPDLWIADTPRRLFLPEPISQATPTPQSISEDSECSIAHPPPPQTNCIVRYKADQRLENAPATIRNVFKRYLENRAVHRGQRHLFLTQVIPPLFTVLEKTVLKELLLLHYDLNCGTWSTSRDEHEAEIDHMLRTWPERYVNNLTPKNRHHYQLLPAELYRAAFRICHDIASREGVFFMSGAELGKRLGTGNQTAYRILKGLASDNLIEPIKQGCKWKAGSRPEATTWKWKLDPRKPDKPFEENCPAEEKCA
jgi:hypothetical protein